MARVKISEYQAKVFLKQALGIAWQGVIADKNTSPTDLKKLFPKESIVVKVDQGIKKRAKQGLVALGVSANQAIAFIKSKTGQGFNQFLVEGLVPHESYEERYLSLERTREGIRILYCDTGGVEIEEYWDKVKETTVPYPKLPHFNGRLLTGAKIPPKFLQQLVNLFDQYYLSFLEINPLVIKGKDVYIIDLAVEIDDAALNLPMINKLGFEEVLDSSISKAEQEVRELDSQTPASLKLKLIDKNAAVWMLLSGGGASLVLADELSDLGYGHLLANYGEYSGNPTSEDTYLYTRIILRQMLRSKAPKKVLIIAGGVANFTDIVKTFIGVIKALTEYKKQLLAQGVKVYVRRGGPNQERGLALMRKFLKEAGLYGHVAGAQEELTRVVRRALAKIKS